MRQRRETSFVVKLIRKISVIRENEVFGSNTLSDSIATEKSVFHVSIIFWREDFYERVLAKGTSRTQNVRIVLTSLNTVG